MELTLEQEYAKREEVGGAPHFDKFGFTISPKTALEPQHDQAVHGSSDSKGMLK